MCFIGKYFFHIFIAGRKKANKNGNKWSSLHNKNTTQNLSKSCTDPKESNRNIINVQIEPNASAIEEIFINNSNEFPADCLKNQTDTADPLQDEPDTCKIKIDQLLSSHCKTEEKDVNTEKSMEEEKLGMYEDEITSIQRQNANSTVVLKLKETDDYSNCDIEEKAIDLYDEKIKVEFNKFSEGTDFKESDVDLKRIEVKQEHGDDIKIEDNNIKSEIVPDGYEVDGDGASRTSVEIPQAESKWE